MRNPPPWLKKFIWCFHFIRTHRSLHKAICFYLENELWKDRLNLQPLCPKPYGKLVLAFQVSILLRFSRRLNSRFSRNHDLWLTWEGYDSRHALLHHTPAIRIFDLRSVRPAELRNLDLRWETTCLFARSRAFMKAEPTFTNRVVGRDSLVSVITL